MLEKSVPVLVPLPYRSLPGIPSRVSCCCWPRSSPSNGTCALCPPRVAYCPLPSGTRTRHDRSAGFELSWAEQLWRAVLSRVLILLSDDCLVPNPNNSPTQRTSLRPGLVCLYAAHDLFSLPSSSLLRTALTTFNLLLSSRHCLSLFVLHSLGAVKITTTAQPDSRART